MFRPLSIFAVMTVALVAQAGAQSTQGTAPKTPAGKTTPPTTMEKSTGSQTKDAAKTAAAGSGTFMTKAAQGGKAEVELGQLAQSKASDPQVKAYGQMLVTDHSAANDELATLARNKSVTVPSDVSAAQKATKDRLDKLTGAAFDKAYMAQMVKDHETDIKEFERAANSADADVKAFASKTLPTLRHHLEEAQRIAKSETGKAASSSKPAGQKSSKSSKGKGQ